MSVCILSLPLKFANSKHTNDTSHPNSEPNGANPEVSGRNEVDSRGLHEEIGCGVDDCNSNLDVFPFSEEDTVEDNKEDKSHYNHGPSLLLFFL